MKIRIFNFDITIERNDDTWQKRLIKRATALAQNEGYAINAASPTGRKIERIKAIRLVRYPYPEDSGYGKEGYVTDNGKSSLTDAKRFVETYWMDEERVK